MATKGKPPKFSGPRKRAEKELPKQPKAEAVELAKDPQKLVHELQVHQIELEMQNDELRKAQSVIEESRSRLADLYDFAPVAYLTFDVNGMVLEANFKACELLGVDKSTLLLMPFSTSFVREDFQRIFTKHRLDVTRQPGKQICELKLKRKDKSLIDARVESIRTVGEDGRINQVRSVILDITDQKRWEEEIQHMNLASEQKVAERTMELKAANSDLLAKETLLEEKLSEIRAHKERLARLSGELEIKVEERTRDLNRKVEELTAAQKDLRKAAHIIDNAGLGLGTTDPAGNTFIFANRVYAEEHGYTQDEMVGLPISDVYAPEVREELGKQIQKVDTEGQASYESMHIRKDGTVFPVLVNSRAVRDEEGKSLYRVVFTQDISELKQAQERINATNALLSLFSKKLVRKEYLDGVVDLIQQWCHCHCVGIRILDERGHVPYGSYVGFSREFWEKEDWISVQKDECACIRVAKGNPGREAGSFHCDDTFEFFGALSEEEKTRFRGVCIQNGFLSVSIVPIRYQDRTLGAIHLADEKEAHLPFKAMEFIESMAPVIGEAINRFNLEEEIKESEERLRSLSAQLLTVQEDERNRFARDVHDSLGAALAAVKYRAEAALYQLTQGMAEPGKTAQSLEIIITAIQQSIEEVRRIQMDLRPPTLDDLGIVPTINWFVREYQKTYSHIRIEKEMDLQEEKVSTHLKTAIYRITQEALNNIAKHSKARLVRLSLRQKDGEVELTIEDDGLGFDSQTAVSSKGGRKGIGLASMKERTELLAGTFTVTSSSEAGTKIQASWPID